MPIRLTGASARMCRLVPETVWVWAARAGLVSAAREDSGGPAASARAFRTMAQSAAITAADSAVDAAARVAEAPAEGADLADRAAVAAAASAVAGAGADLEAPAAAEDAGHKWRTGAGSSATGSIEDADSSSG